MLLEAMKKRNIIGKIEHEFSDRHVEDFIRVCLSRIPGRHSIATDKGPEPIRRENGNQNDPKPSVLQRSAQTDVTIPPVKDGDGALQRRDKSG